MPKIIHHKASILERKQVEIASMETERLKDKKERSNAVDTLIREEYSLSKEISILRKNQAKINKFLADHFGDFEKDEDFEEYNQFAELCKEQVDGETTETVEQSEQQATTINADREKAVAAKTKDADSFAADLAALLG